MSYWRMQLHPAKPGEAVKHAVESLGAGYIGLDFAEDLGDLLRLNQSDLPDGQRDFWGFANEMGEGDVVLIIAHHFPFALVRIAGPYNYIRSCAPELGVWFRHFRRVDSVRYYADLITDARKWQQIKMTDTISPLRDRESLSYQLIESWAKST